MPGNRRRRALHLGLAAAATCWALAPAGTAQAQPVVLKNGRIIPVVGEEVRKGSIVIKGGRITAIGPADKVEEPFDAKVYDCTGKVLFPGMIDAHTAGGLDVPNESAPITPFLNVADAIDPSQMFFEDSLRDGVTAIHVMQGENTAIGGLSRVVRPIGMTPAEMTIAPDTALKICITPKSGFDRMMQMATLREAFRKLADDMEQLAEKRYEEKLKEDGKPLDVPPDEARKRGKELVRMEDVPEKDRTLLLLTQGKMASFIYCRNAMDVAPAIKLAKENGFFDRCVLVVGTECYKAVDEIKKAGRPVVLDAELYHRETHPITGEEKKTFVPGVFDKAGVPFVLQRQRGASLGERYLWYQAARCVREGISRQKAVEAITLNAARAVGLEKRLGSLETGKDGSVLVLSGDPLDVQTWVEQGFIEGVLVYERDKDIRLKELLSTPKEELKGPGPTRPADEETSRPASGEDEDEGDRRVGGNDDEDDAPRSPPERRRPGGRRPPRPDEGGDDDE